MNPTSVLDYCESCGGHITPWGGETCGCCGREWGSDTTADGSPPACRSVHILGAVWTAALDAEGTTDA